MIALRSQLRCAVAAAIVVVVVVVVFCGTGGRVNGL